jgi:PAS domain S-box-containing protein
MIQMNLLKILFVEDMTSDVDLAVLELRKEKIKFEYATVCTRIDLIKALKDFRPDLIISDYMMPAFNGLEALKEVKSFNPDIPFILFTGSINEETAVECIKEGAQDYVIKEHMTRLPFAVKEALEQVSINKEKRASELLLIENEEKLQSIFSAAPVGIGLLVNGILIEVNDFFCSLIGYIRKELIGKSFEILYPSTEEFIKTREEIYSQISEKGIGTAESNFKCKDGKILNVILSSAALDKNDHSKGVTVTVLDITERKRSEEALKESQDLFKTLAQVSPVGIFRTKPDGYTNYVNPKWLELSGLTSEEAVGFGWLKAVHPDDRAHLGENWKTAIKSQQSSYAEYRFIRADGSIVWVMGYAVPEWNNDSIIGYIGTITDITEHKLAEEAIAESERKYRTIFENVQDLYYETAIDGTIIEVSPSIEFLSKGQYRRNDLIGKSIYNFYSDAKERAAIISQLKERGTVSDFEITLKNKDGSTVPCSVSSKIYFDTLGLPEKIIGSMHDITDRKNVSNALNLAKEKAEASDKLKTSFLNNISHEVRTPLNGILGFAEIMSLPDISDEDKKESLLMLNESSDRLLNTITNYMDVSLLTSGSLSVNKKDFIQSKILRRIFENFEPLCSNKKLELMLKIPENTENYTINSDPEIFQKIISHLLNNAVKFTEKGSMHFGYSMHESVFEFFVKDTGIGIGKESIEIVFDTFAKEDRGHFKITEGSGLGLSIAKGMTEALGGKISVESVLGEGSCFYVSIPSGKMPFMDLSVKSGNEIKKTTGGNMILVAEDDETNFYYLDAIIKRETHAKILHASNGKEAIELFKANPGINLVLMDIKMPEINGFEATQQIKLINHNVPVIALTAYAMSGDEERIIAAGFDGYLSKPINKKNLLEKIAEYIRL